jgi:hypothetical protein
VVTGVQHYLLVQILMAAHNPATPKLGPDQARATREVDLNIKRNVSLLCGIAEVRETVLFRLCHGARAD